MALRNYWWLLIWALLAGGVYYLPLPREEGAPLRRCARRETLIIALLALPYVFWAAWRTDAFGDTAVYRSRFLAAPDSLSALSAYVSAQSRDRGYAALELGFKALVSSSDTAFFFVIAALQMLCLVFVYRRYSRNLWLSLFFFIASGDYLSWMHNGIRQFLAAAALFACLPLLVEKRYGALVFITLLLSRIHGTALLFLPFIFAVQGRPWNGYMRLFLALTVLAAAFPERLRELLDLILQNTQYNGEAGQLVYGYGTSLPRVLFYALPTVLSLLFHRRIEEAEEPVICLCVNLSIVSTCLYILSRFTSGVYTGRLPIYFSLANYILIPWLLEELFTEDSALLLETLFVVLYSVFFYYQLHLGWGLL